MKPGSYRGYILREVEEAYDQLQQQYIENDPLLYKLASDCKDKFWRLFNQESIGADGVKPEVAMQLTGLVETILDAHFQEENGDFKPKNLNPWGLELSYEEQDPDAWKNP